MIGFEGCRTLEGGVCLDEEAVQEAELRRNVGGRGAVAGPAGYVYTVEGLIEKVTEGDQGLEGEWVSRIDS